MKYKSKVRWKGYSPTKLYMNHLLYLYMYTYRPRK
jgi:hypothetical protein